MTSRGALAAMRAAVSAGGAAPEQDAYVRSLLGGLELQHGRIDAAVREYRGALEAMPRYAAAEAGLAQADVARGRLAPAIARLQRVVDRLPLASYVIALGEAQAAAGRRAAAARTFALVRVETMLQQRAGVNADVELALFEADHGSPQRAVALGRKAWAAAPSVRSADALGWALHSAGHSRAALGWARRALALGSRDPAFLTHAGLIARSAGERAVAARWLARARDGPRRAGRRPAGGAAMRRLLLAAALALLALAAPAGAHPLGNFSINHLAVVRVSSDRVDVRYVLDQAEIPTFQERGLPAGAGARAQARGRRARRDPDGRRAGPCALTLRPGGRIDVPPGRGGAAHDARGGAAAVRRSAPRGAVVVRDATFAGRVGWRAVLAEPGRGTAVRSDVTSADPTRRLRVYPTALLASPADRTVAHLRVRPGSRHGHRAARRRQPGDDDRPRGGRRLRLGLRARGRRSGRAAAAPARRLRMGRRARALAGTRQGDGGRLPRRHPRDRAPRGGPRA